jgi:hypothetical protein
MSDTESDITWDESDKQVYDSKEEKRKWAEYLDKMGHCSVDGCKHPAEVSNVCNFHQNEYCIYCAVEFTQHQMHTHYDMLGSGFCEQCGYTERPSEGDVFGNLIVFEVSDDRKRFVLRTEDKTRRVFICFDANANNKWYLTTCWEADIEYDDGVPEPKESEWHGYFDTHTDAIAYSLDMFDVCEDSGVTPDEDYE